MALLTRQEPEHRGRLWQFIEPKDSSVSFTFPRIISLSTLRLKAEGAFYTLLCNTCVLTFPRRCTTAEVQNPTFLKTNFRGICNCQCKRHQPSLLKIFHFYCFTFLLFTFLLFWNELTMKSRCLKKKKKRKDNNLYYCISGTPVHSLHPM